MRTLALVLLPLAITILIVGVMFVPWHDGRLSDLALLILLPSAGVSWCTIRLLPKPRQEGETNRT